MSDDEGTDAGEVLRLLAEGLSQREVCRRLGLTRYAVGEIAKGRSVHAGEPVPPVLKRRRRFDPIDPAYRAPTVARLRKGPATLGELQDFLGVDASGAHDMIRSLVAAGYSIDGDESGYRITGTLLPETLPHMLDTSRLTTDEVEIGVVADSHMSSTRQRLDVLEMAYDEFARRGVTFAVLCGNAIDGYLEPINGGEVLLRNATDQFNYFADHYPQRAGIVTKFITGQCHEGWWAKKIGLDVGKSMEFAAHEAGRDDLEYIGHLERDIPLSNGNGGGAVLRVLHPGGGTAYAQSYQPQKIVESYQGGEKPHILVIGHYHKLGCFYPRGVWCVLAGCCQDQTRWMRGRHISAHVGFGVIRFRLDKTGGVSGFAYDQYPFYDRGYHIDAGEWEVALGDALAR